MGLCFSTVKAKAPFYSMTKFDLKDRMQSENKSTVSQVSGENQKESDEMSKSHDFQLGNNTRRRLTVSTVVCNNNNNNNNNTNISSSPKSESLVLNKMSSAMLDLIDSKTNTIKNVSVNMIYDLVNKEATSLLIFGVLTNFQQLGFDKKEKAILGTRAEKKPKIPNVGYACHKGLKPESPNQDDFFILQLDEWSLYGVFDGHGPYGHDVSNIVRNSLPYLLLSNKDFLKNPLETMQNSFRKTHELLEAISNNHDDPIDCALSGTTATIILHRDQELYVAHVGDSRGVVAEKVTNSRHIRAINLTSDHKPTRDDEKERIEAAGGEIKRLEGDVPHRVFAKNKPYPGLAMSRALGDTIGAIVGIIPDPEVQKYQITKNTKFMIIATDGIWEFISSQEAVDFVAQQTRKKAQRAAEHLAYESWSRWIAEEGHVVDDLTCLVVWFPNNSDK